MFGRLKLTIIVVSALVVLYGVVGGARSRVAARDDVYGDLGVFADVISKIRDDYVERPDLEKAMRGALHGMLEALDPYCSFVDSETYRSLSALEQARGSPGLLLSKRYGYAYVVAVVRGSPAEREGLRSADLLESIEGKGTPEMSLWEAQRLLRGPVGSSVKMRVVRARRAEPTEITLTREETPSRPVMARIVEDGIGLLQIPDFEKGASTAILSKLRMLQSSGIQGLIVDVRGAAQGLLEEAVAVSGFFLPKGSDIVTVRDRAGKETRQLSWDEPVVSGIPMVVLTDGGTSGAAEVLSAALQDHQVAETVGERTNGQGSEQELFTLEDGSVLMISTRLLYRAHDKPLQDQNLRNSGVTPDTRSPDPDFVMSFYFDNASEDLDRNLDAGFYRRLSEAIQAEQLKSGLMRIRSKVLKKAA